MKRNRIKAFSGLAAVLLAANTVFTPVYTTSPVKAEMTIQDLEEQKAENDKKIAELKKEIEESKKQYDIILSDENAKLEYQDALNEKITLQNENIGAVIKQMNQIDADIQETLSDISDIESQIKTQNRMIDKNMSLYKERLRASYMSGDNTLSSVLSGSTSFLDILSKFEIISRVAEHDNNLIKVLEKQLSDLRTMNDKLGIRQQELTENLEDATEKKSELDEKLSELQTDYDETQEELDKISDKKYIISNDIETNNEIIAAKEAEMEQIDAQIEEVMEQIRQESIAESKRVSESVSISIEESKREESRRAEAEKPVTQPPVQAQKPVTEAPEEDDEPETPSDNGGYDSAPSVDTSSSLMLWPVPGYTHLSSDFWDGRNHGAIDVDGVGGPGGAISGAYVYAAADGIVAAFNSGCTHNTYSCSCGGGYGNYAGIAHTDGVYSTYYAHLQSVFVTKGQYVSKGTVIGIVGSTGYSTGPHLHFEVRKNNVKMNPMEFSYQNFY